MMSDEKRKPLHPETNFLPPLKMVLAFLDRDSFLNTGKKDAEKKEDSTGKNIEKLIEKLSEEDE